MNTREKALTFPKKYNTDEIPNLSNLSKYSNLDDLYFDSGMKILKDFLVNELSCSFYFEYAIFSSCVEDNLLKDFAIVYNHGNNEDIHISKLQENWPSIYNSLRKKNKGIFFKDRFFIKPIDNTFYISSDSSQCPSELYYENSPSEDYFKNKKIDKNTHFFNLSVETKLDFNIFNNNGEYTKGDIDDYNKLLHKIFDNEFLNKSKNQNTTLLSIPIIGAPVNNPLLSNNLATTNYDDKIHGQGAAFLYIAGNDKSLEFLEALANKISYFIKDIILNYLFYSGIKLSIEAKKNALKTAISAIMSRNMSHNIGSHVLSYLKDHLRSTKSMLDNVVFEDLIQKTESYCEADILEIKKQFIFNVEEIHTKSSQDYSNAKFLIGLGRLLNYIQERQDFIATITSDSMPFFISVNFKDFIYDEINHDKKTERHYDSHEKELNLLLDNIARSEEIVRHKPSSEQHKLVLKFRNFNGSRLPDAYLSSKEKQMKKDLDDMRLYDIELPSGIMGRQAIFSIMENFIRNSAKHGGERKDDLEITLNISESDSDEKGNPIYPEFYKITINDNNRNANKLTYKTKKVIGANNKEKEINLTVEELIRLSINDPVIEDGILNDSYKGIKEMKISALWLRRLEPSRIEDNDIDPPLLDVSTDENNNIVYSFYVYKPHKVAIISDELNQFMNKQKPFAAQFDNKRIFASWKFYTSEEALMAESIPYNFVINYGSSISYQELRKKIPVRYLDAEDFKEKPIIDLLNKEYKNFEKEDFLDIQNEIERYLYEEIYELWLKKKAIHPKKQKILIVDKKTRDNLDSEPLKIDNQFVEVYMSLSLNDLKKISPKPTIIYRKHNDTLSDFKKFKDSYLKKLPEVSNNLVFIEGVSGGNSTDRVIRNEIKDNLWFYRTIESAHLSVLIIDERIWEAYNEDYCDVFRKKRIEILNIVKKKGGNQYVIKDLQHKKEGTYNKEMINDEKLNGNKVKLPLEKYDFLVMHQGLIDKFTGNKNVNKTFNIFRGLAHFTLIHSGRSKPPKEQFPDNCAFIQYSSLQKALQDCKLTLTELLLSSIKEK